MDFCYLIDDRVSRSRYVDLHISNVEQDSNSVGETNIIAIVHVHGRCVHRFRIQSNLIG